MTCPFPIGQCCVCHKPAKPELIYCDDHQKRADELLRARCTCHDDSGACPACQEREMRVLANSAEGA